MILKIGNRKMDQYNGVTVALKYDSVASTFSFDLFFDPSNPEHREIFRPGSYAPATIEHEGQRLITGTLLSHTFTTSAERSLVPVSGYSKTGVLEDCPIPTSAYPLQTNGLSLKQIVERCIKPFGIGLVVDSAVASRADKKYTTSIANDRHSVKEYLSLLAGQRHIMLSHDAQGNLLLTQANTSAAPTFEFTTGMPGVRITHQFDGQRMHSDVTLIKQQTKGRKDGTHKKGNAGQSSYDNPFVEVFRPRVTRQTSGKDVDTALAARNMLSEELKGLAVKIDIDRWILKGQLVRPNTIITVKDPDLYLYNPTRFFVAEVEYRGNNNEQTASLTCYLPSVFGSEAPVNIYK